jgi:dihydroorotase
VNDNATVTEYILRKARDEGKARVFPVGAVSQGLKGEKLSNFGDLKEAGAVALSDDGKPVANSGVMRHALEYARNFDLPIISHCEDPFLFCGGHLNEGIVSLQLGLGGIPNAAEDIMVSRDIELAGLTKGRVHLAHLSTSGSVRLLRHGKDRGIRVTGEVTPHHLLLTEEAVRDYNTNAKMNPPLRTEEDRQELIKALRDGVFDAIASDHAPHSQDEKDVEFEQAPFGIIGLETTVSLVLKLVHDGILKPLEVIRLLTSGPAKIVGLAGGTLKKGALADVAIILPEESRTIEKSRLASKSKNTPFHGWKVKGAVRMTILNGEVVYDAKA